MNKNNFQQQCYLCKITDYVLNTVERVHDFPENLINNIINGVIRDVNDKLNKQSNDLIYDVKSLFSTKYNLFDSVKQNNRIKPVCLYPFVEIPFDTPTALEMIDSINSELLIQSVYKNLNDIDSFELNPLQPKKVPTCYILLGKPGLDQEEIAEKFSIDFNCVHVSLKKLVKREIDSNTLVGKCFLLNASFNKAFPIDLLLYLVEKEMELNTVQTRGYILSGLPYIPEYTIHPHSGRPRSYTLDEIRFFEDILNEVIDDVIIMEGSATHINRFRNLLHCFEKIFLDFIKSGNSPFQEPPSYTQLQQRILHRKLNTEEDVQNLILYQLNFIYNLDIKPSIIIYIECCNEDVIIRCTTNIFNKPLAPEVISNYFDSKENIQRRSILKSDVRILNKGIEDKPKSVRISTLVNYDTELNMKDYNFNQHFYKRYNINDTVRLLSRYEAAFSHIQTFLLYFPLENVLRLDGRYSAADILTSIKNQLANIPINRNYAVIPFFPEIVDDKNFSVDDFDDLDQLEILKSLCKLKRIQLNFPWKKTAFMSKCPVRMHEGKFVNGKPEFCVKYISHLFLLSSMDSLEMFCQNPTKYTICNRPTCRIAICGPSFCGKSTLAHLFERLLGGKIIDVKLRFQMLEEQQRLSNYYEALKLARDRAQDEIREKYENEENIRLENVEEWRQNVTESLEFISDLKKVMDNEQTEKYKKLKLELEKNYGILINNPEDATLLLKDPLNVEKFMPHGLLPKRMQIVTDNDEIVKEYLEEELDELHLENDSISVDDHVETLVKRIQEIERITMLDTNDEQKYGNWILDGIPCDDIDLWVGLEENGCLPDVLISLYDSTGDTLKKIYQKKYQRCFLDADYVIHYISNKYSNFFNTSVQIKSNSLVKRELHNETIVNPTINYSQEQAESVQEQCEEYQEDFENLKEYLVENQPECEILSIDIDKEIWTDVLVNVLCKYFDMYKETALVLSEDDISTLILEGKQLYKQEKRRQFSNLSEELDKDVESNKTTITSSSLSSLSSSIEQTPFLSTTEHQKLIEWKIENYMIQGSTLNYCPVAFYDKNILFKGKLKYMIEYKNKNYKFCTNEALQLFLTNPTKYSDSNNLKNRKIPHLRAIIIGQIGSGKTRLAHQLCYKYNLENFNFETILNNNAKVSTEKIFNIENYRKLIDENHREIINDIITNIFQQDNFILDGYPMRSEDFQEMIEKHLIPEVIIIVKEPLEIVKKRHISGLISNWKNYIAQMVSKYDRDKYLIYQNWLEKRHQKYEELMNLKRYQYKIRKRNEARNISVENSSTTSDSIEKIESIRTFSKPPILETVSEEGNHDSVEMDKMNQFVPTYLDIEIMNDEVENYLMETFAAPIFPKNPNISTTDIENMIVELENIFEELYAVDSKEIDEIIEIAEEHQIEIIDVGKLNSINFDIKLDKLNDYIYRSHFFANQALSIFGDNIKETVDTLLEQNYFQYSKYFKTCPVARSESIYNPLSYANTFFPCVYQEKIYFLKLRENFKKFQVNPWEFMPKPLHIYKSTIPIRICVIGPEYSGVKTVCNRFAIVHNINVFNINNVIDYVKTNLKWTKLARSIATDTNLTNMKDIPDYIIIDCLLSQKNKFYNGWIIDSSIRITPSILDHMRNSGISPHLVVNLKINIETVLKNFWSEYWSDVNPKKICTITKIYEIIKNYEYFTTYIKKFEDYNKYDNPYHNFVSVEQNTCDKYNSKWWLLSFINREIYKTVVYLSEYEKTLEEGKCSRLGTIIMCPIEFYYRLNQSYKLLCPICYINSNLLVEYRYERLVTDYQYYYRENEEFNDYLASMQNSNTDRHIDIKFNDIYSNNFFIINLLQYQNQIYWTCDIHLLEMYFNPSGYSLVRQKNILAQSPKLVTTYPLDMVYQDGYCIPTYVENLPNKVLVKGRSYYSIYYQWKIYLCSNRETALLLLQNPQKYASIQIIEDSETDNGDEAYFENLKRLTSSLLLSGLIKVGLFRPKHSELDFTKSALTYLGLFLKSSNKLSFSTLMERLFDKYKLKCQLFKQELDVYKSTLNPFIEFNKSMSDISISSDNEERSVKQTN